MREYKIKLYYANNFSAVDSSYVMRVLLFECRNVFEASKLACDYLADETCYPYKIDVEEFIG